MKNQRHQEFNVGRKGSGIINFFDGDLEFEHENTLGDASVIPISISHVYSSKNARNRDTVFGRGFKLNLHQTLKTVNPDDDSCAEYIYTDASGAEHPIEEKFYFETGGRRHPLRKNQVEIGQDGKLTFTEDNVIFEVISEIKTRTGLSIETTLGVFKGSEKIDTRHEELIQINNEIKQLNRSVEDLNYSLVEYGKMIDNYMDNPDGTRTRIIGEGSNVVRQNPNDPKSKIIESLKTIQNRIEKKSRELENQMIIDFAEGVRRINDSTNILRQINELSPEAVDELFSINVLSILSPENYNNVSNAERQEYVNRLRERFHELVKRSDQYVASISVNEEGNTWSASNSNRFALVSSPLIDSKQAEIEFVRIANRFGENSLNPCVPTDPNMIRQFEHHVKSLNFRERSDRLNQKITEISARMENENWEEQKKNAIERHELIKLQDNFLKLKAVYDTLEDSRIRELITHTEYDIEIAKAMIVRKTFIYDQMKRQFPVRFITGGEDGGALGFNEDGDLVAIFDELNNQTVILFEDILNSNQKRISRVIDSNEQEITFEYDVNSTSGRLVAIKDFQNRRTEFCYNIGDNRTDFLRTIKYPNGDEFKFEYSTEGLISRMISPFGTGVALEYSANSNVSKMSDVSTEGDLSGELSITGYGANIRNVSCAKSGIASVYHFDEDGNAKAEYDIIQDRPRNLVVTKTKYEPELFNPVYSLVASSDRIFTNQDEIESVISNFADNVETIDNIRSNVSADFDWVYSSFDDGKLVREYYSDQTHGEAAHRITRSMRKEFEYRDDLLIKEVVTVEKTGEDIKNYVTSYEYDEQDRQIRSVDETSGMISETIFEEDGNVKTQTYHRSNPSAKIIEEQKIDDKGKIHAEVDEVGNKSKLDYYGKSNIIRSITGPTNQKISFGTNPHTNELASISTSVDSEANTNLFQYEKEQLVGLCIGNAQFDLPDDSCPEKGGESAEVSNGGTKFRFAHDSVGRRNRVDINGKNYVSYIFQEDGDNTIVIANYANGEGYRTTIDRLDRVQTIEYMRNGAYVRFISNEYDDKNENGDIRHLDLATRTTNHITGEVTTFEYDCNGNLIEQSGRVNVQNVFNIDDAVTHTRVKVKRRDDVYEDSKYTYNYNNDGQLIGVELPTGKEETLHYDNLGRIAKFETIAGAREINYFANGERASTAIPSSEVHRAKDGSTTKRRYTYDANGNITYIHEAGQLVARYTYDGLNRLTREDNRQLGCSYAYEYDNNGNILTKQKFNFTLVDFDEVLNTTPNHYHYKGDQLETLDIHSPDGCIKAEKSEYDAIGNPTLYRNKVCAWDHVRNLVAYDGRKTRFEYDQSGLRTIKRQNDAVSEYFYAGGQLVAEKSYGKFADLYVGDELEESYITKQETFITYLYGVDGITGFSVEQSGEKKEYYYRKNVQGDVTHIYNKYNKLVAKYVYDAWGNAEMVEEVAWSIGGCKERQHMYGEAWG